MICIQAGLGSNPTPPVASQRASVVKVGAELTCRTLSRCLSLTYKHLTHVSSDVNTKSQVIKNVTATLMHIFPTSTFYYSDAHISKTKRRLLSSSSFIQVSFHSPSTVAPPSDGAAGSAKPNFKPNCQENGS